MILLIFCLEGGSANSNASDEEGKPKVSMQDVRKANTEVRKAKAYVKNMELELKKQQAEQDRIQNQKDAQDLLMNHMLSTDDFEVISS